MDEQELNFEGIERQPLRAFTEKAYLDYSMYVILDRALPALGDGLKPVQRRIMHTLFTMHDGKFHKVANVAGQTMAYHPHGDAPIYEAMVNIGLRGLLLDTQGNFGNLYTGDPAAAARCDGPAHDQRRERDLLLLAVVGRLVRHAERSIRYCASSGTGRPVASPLRPSSHAVPAMSRCAQR